MSRTSKTYGGLLSAALVAGLAFAPAAVAQECDSCGKGRCPPHFKYHYEGPPKIKFKHGCPRPICDPCYLPHYGYFPTCWHPWPFPPDWSHCAVPPPGALLPHDIPPPGTRRILGEPPLPEGEKPGVPRRSAAPSDTPPVATAGPFKYAVPVSAEKPTVDPVADTPGWPATAPPVPPMSLPQGTSPERRRRDQLDAAPTRLPDVLGVPPPSAEPRLKPIPEPLKAGGGWPLSLRNDSTPGKPAPMIVQTAAASPASPSPDAQRPKQVSTGPGGNNVRMVNSRRIMLDYDRAKIEQPDQTVLELWFTQDGRTWEKDRTSLKSGSPYEVEVDREGRYGFTLVARHVGVKCDPPPPGEQPDVWVEVDWTKPVVHRVQASQVGDPVARQLAVAWLATDNNLAAQPITLSWAESPAGPWHTIAAKIENTGRYTWQVHDNVPARVHLRVEARDLVGNVGTATTLTPVIIPGGGR